MTHKLKMVVPLARCGDLMGRASAVLVILGTLSFAVAALMVDLL